MTSYLKFPSGKLRTMGYTDEDIHLVTTESLELVLTVGGRKA